MVAVPQFRTTTSATLRARCNSSMSVTEL